MQISDLIRRFKGTRERQEKAVFSTLCIAENRLQTIFDKSSSGITLKQFDLPAGMLQAEYQEAGRSSRTEGGRYNHTERK